MTNETGPKRTTGNQAASAGEMNSLSPRCLQKNTDMKKVAHRTRHKPVLKKTLRFWSRKMMDRPMKTRSIPSTGRVKRMWKTTATPATCEVCARANSRKRLNVEQYMYQTFGRIIVSKAMSLVLRMNFPGVGLTSRSLRVQLGTSAGNVPVKIHDFCSGS